MASSPEVPAEVYRLQFDANRYAALLSVDEADWDWEAPRWGQPVGAQWAPPPHYWETEDTPTDRPIPDYSEIDSVPVFSERALAALGELLEGRGERLELPVTDSEQQWRMFNITRLSEALDEDGSEIERFDDGRIMWIDRYAFHAELLAGETIFKLAPDPIHRYVTDAFRRRVEQAGLTGFVWDKRVWPAPPRAPEPDPQDQARLFTRLVPGEDELGDPDELVTHRIIPAFEADNGDLIGAQAKAHALGIGPDDGPNGCFVSRRAHREAYSEDYFAALNNRLGRAQNREEGEAVLRHIGHRLEAGEFPGEQDR